MFLACSLVNLSLNVLIKKGSYIKKRMYTESFNVWCQNTRVSVLIICKKTIVEAKTSLEVLFVVLNSGYIWHAPSDDAYYSAVT